MPNVTRIGLQMMLMRFDIRSSLFASSVMFDEISVKFVTPVGLKFSVTLPGVCGKSVVEAK